MLERENAFYQAHQVELREKYLEKWLVIVGESLWGVYGTFHEAAKNAFANFEPGEFMLHTPSDDGKLVEIGPVVQYADDKPKPESAMTYSAGELVVFPYA